MMLIRCVQYITKLSVKISAPNNVPNGELSNNIDSYWLNGADLLVQLSYIRVQMTFTFFAIDFNALSTTLNYNTILLTVTENWIGLSNIEAENVSSNKWNKEKKQIIQL